MGGGKSRVRSNRFQMGRLRG